MCALSVAALSAAAWATDAPGVNELALELPTVIGAERRVPIEGPDDTLLDVAARYAVGFDALLRLNPGVDAWMPPPQGEVALPTRMIPPNAPRRGLVINIPEMRLYDYTRGTEPEVLPLAIGDPTTPTPIGQRKVLWKTTDPVWKVPESIRLANPLMPREVPPGDDNPLGRYWLALGDGYGIHGTNITWSIGRVATHGCIRMYNDQIESLYRRVPVGTPVTLVYQTVKLGRVGEELYLEAHPDVYGLADRPVPRTLAHLRVLGMLDDVDRQAVARGIEEARGVPIRIGRAPVVD